MKILKSMRFKFSNLALMMFFCSVVFAKPPVINSFKADRYEGFNPMTVKLTVDAYDPEGDTLQYTFHIIDQDGFQTDFISETNSINYTFSGSGNYNVRVTVFGSHNESTDSDALNIKVLSSDAPIKISVLTSRQLAKVLGIDYGKVSAKTVFFNDKDYNVTLTIKGYNNGEVILEHEETVLPNSYFIITEQYLVHPTTDVVVFASAHIPVFSDVYTPDGIARAWYGFDNATEMYLPYIEENLGFRKTYAFISNPYVKPVSFTYNEEITELPQDYSIMVNAGSFVTPYMNTQNMWGGNKCWALIKDEIINTVGPDLVEERTLNGLGISVDFDNKPAMYELKREGSTTLYLPFIPQVDCYNDLVLLNTGDRETDVTIDFYNGHGIKTGSYNLKIAEQERRLIYLESIIENLNIEADYAIITSVQPLLGVNEVKLLYGGEYAYSLQTYTECRGFSPVILNDSYYWTVLSIVNPNDEEISVNFALYTASGKFRTSQAITIPAYGTLASYVTNIFNDIDIHKGDSIIINSVKPISGITLSGDESLSRLNALPIF